MVNFAFLENPIPTTDFADGKNAVQEICNVCRQAGHNYKGFSTAGVVEAQNQSQRAGSGDGLQTVSHQSRRYVDNFISVLTAGLRTLGLMRLICNPVCNLTSAHAPDV